MELAPDRTGDQRPVLPRLFENFIIETGHDRLGHRGGIMLLVHRYDAPVP
ncbi:hypothetical protein SDC9_80238 [bioreactor metagenome]|uniref:Uncharacterized protein n=1 Tax=bioreactor metagenome TaxID=1076179 RepID=A0A644Z0X3_9ZZZZ